MKLLNETLKFAYAEKKQNANRSVWYQKLIDILAFFLHFFLKHTSYYRKDFINKGLKFLEKALNKKDVNLDDKNINIIFNAINEFSSISTKNQKIKHKQLTKKYNILSNANIKKANDTDIDTDEEASNPQILMDQTHGAPRDEPMDIPFRNNHNHDIKLQIPNLLIGSSSIEYIRLSEFLKWTRKDIPFKNRSLDGLIESMLENYDNYAKPFHIFHSFIKKVEHQAERPNKKILSDFVHEIKTKNPHIYRFFFEPLTSQRAYFKSNPFIVWMFEPFQTENQYQSEDNKNRAVRDFIIRVMFANYLKEHIEFTEEEGQINFIIKPTLAISSETNKGILLMLHYFTNKIFFQANTIAYLNNNLTFRENKLSIIEAKLSKTIYTHCADVFNEIDKMYELIADILDKPSIGHNMFNDENTSFNQFNGNKPTLALDM